MTRNIPVKYYIAGHLKIRQRQLLLYYYYTTHGITYSASLELKLPQSFFPGSSFLGRRSMLLLLLLFCRGSSESDELEMRR